jgi:16S rRNA (cytosine967-C5)-methyltransferase
MPIAPARIAAFDILLRVEQTDAFSSELLHSTAYGKLTSADHGLATELVMGVLRWRSLLDQRLSTASSLTIDELDLEVLTALRLAAYQLQFLQRVPPHAAVNDSVELVKRARKRSAAAFVNAVLRKLGPTPDSDQSPTQMKTETAEELSSRLPHPRWLVDRWIREFSLETAQKICAYNQQLPQTAIRLGANSMQAELQAEGIKLATGRLLSGARRVVAGNISKTRAFRSGKIAIQDEGSQLVALVVGKGKNILDCCAAPGGKTRIMAARNPQSEVLALELHPQRAALLRKLASATNVRVATADARDFAVTKAFDRVLVDVPCSGTGTLARNPEIKWRLTPHDLSDLQARQLEILRSAMKQVAPGGRLVYSTCSLEREENSEVVEKALAEGSDFGVVNPREELERLKAEGELAWPDLDSMISSSYVRTLPGVHPCDGFFAAVLEKCSRPQRT